MHRGENAGTLIVTIGSGGAAGMFAWGLLVLLNFLLKRYGPRRIWLIIAMFLTGILLIAAAVSPRDVPGAHRRVRRFYDRVGPLLARGLKHPVLADVAYWILKPAEWGVVFLLRRLVVDFDGLAQRIYGVSIDADRKLAS